MMFFSSVINQSINHSINYNITMEKIGKQYKCFVDFSIRFLLWCVLNCLKGKKTDKRKKNYIKTDEKQFDHKKSEHVVLEWLP